MASLVTVNEKLYFISIIKQNFKAVNYFCCAYKRKMCKCTKNFSLSYTAAVLLSVFVNESTSNMSAWFILNNLVRNTFLEAIW